jgi:hypothetical protein
MMKLICRVTCLMGLALLLLAPSQGIADDEDLEPVALFQRRCTKCHTLERTNRIESPEFWRDTVQKMAFKDSSGISERDMEIIGDYLVDTHSR